MVTIIPLAVLWVSALSVANSMTPIARDSMRSLPPSAAASASATATIHIKLQFDGCLRPPRDPGFPTISHRMAVCAACVGVVCEIDGSSNSNSNSSSSSSDNNTITVAPLAAGAVALPVTTETTSQHAEYEGLLLGLEWLVDFFSRPDWNDRVALALAPANHRTTRDANRDKGDNNDNKNKNKNNDSDTRQQQQQQQRVLLSIEGDCKTVIDQLSGTSIPRKLESLHERARALLHRLAGDDGNSTTTTTRQSGMLLETECFHVPRSQNQISDALCNNLMTVLAANSWRRGLHRLKTHPPAENDSPGSSGSGRGGAHHREPSSLSDLLERSVIPETKRSLRPPLYELVAELAAENEDHPLLVRIGERLVEEASVCGGGSAGVGARTRAATTGTGTTHRGPPLSWKRTGVSLQIKGWKGLGKEKKVRFLERKHRVLLASNANANANANADGIAIEDLGDVSEGDWEGVVPNTWRPMLEEWFVSARYPDETTDELLPVWVER